MASCCRCERSRESASSASSRSFSLKYLMTKTIATGNPKTARTLTMGMSAASISEDMAPVNVPDPGPCRARAGMKRRAAGDASGGPPALAPTTPCQSASHDVRAVKSVAPPYRRRLVVRSSGGRLVLERVALLDLALLDQLLAALLLGFALLLDLVAHRLGLLAALLLAVAASLHALAAALQPLRAIGSRSRRRDEQRRDHPVARLHGPSPAGSSLRRVGTVRRGGGKRPKPRGLRRRICADVADRPPWAAARGAGRAPRGRRRRRGSPWPRAGRSTRAGRPGLRPAPAPRP